MYTGIDVKRLNAALFLRIRVVETLADLAWKS